MSLIGKVVEYSVTNKERLVGVILDKISMSTDAEKGLVVTGYLVQNSHSKAVKPVQNWRILKIVENEREIPAHNHPFDDVPNEPSDNDRFNRL